MESYWTFLTYVAVVFIGFLVTTRLDKIIKLLEATRDHSKGGTNA